MYGRLLLDSMTSEAVSILLLHEGKFLLFEPPYPSFGLTD